MLARYAAVGYQYARDFAGRAAQCVDAQKIWTGVDARRIRRRAAVQKMEASKKHLHTGDPPGKVRTDVGPGRKRPQEGWRRAGAI